MKQDIFSADELISLRRQDPGISGFGYFEVDGPEGKTRDMEEEFSSIFGKRFPFNYENGYVHYRGDETEDGYEVFISSLALISKFMTTRKAIMDGLIFLYLRDKRFFSLCLVESNKVYCSTHPTKHPYSQYLLPGVDRDFLPEQLSEERLFRILKTRNTYEIIEPFDQGTLYHRFMGLWMIQVFGSDPPTKEQEKRVGISNDDFEYAHNDDTIRYVVLCILTDFYPGKPCSELLTLFKEIIPRECYNTYRPELLEQEIGEINESNMAKFRSCLTYRYRNDK